MRTFPKRLIPILMSIVVGVSGCSATLGEPGAPLGEVRSATGGPCPASGACWIDVQSVNIAGASAPGRTGQWWCTNHFGTNLGGPWECLDATGATCAAQVPASGIVTCGRMELDGTTSYASTAHTVTPLGYGRVEQVIAYAPASGRTGQWWCENHFAGLGGKWKCRSVSGNGSCSDTVNGGELVSCSQYADVQSVNVYAAGPGRTGQWWCNNHFAANLGGSWDCLQVAGSACASDASSGAAVTCGRYAVVDEAAFAAPACDSPVNDSSEVDFCRYTEYTTTRQAATLYLYNDFLRAGFNRSFGGALFELYGSDKRNRIEEHGGAAAQLSIWGYDPAASGSAYYTTTSCSATPYTDPSTCATANGGAACRAFPATGAQLSNCSTEKDCVGWSAGAPWNPLQAQGAECGWNGPTNDVSAVSQNTIGVELTKSNPYNFTKTTAFPGLTFYTTGQVRSDRPYLRVHYRMVYSGRNVGAHNQEIPALFADNRINYWYYFYQGTTAYADAGGAVTRLRADFGSALKLPARGTPPTGLKSPFAGSEDWMTVCDQAESQCLTVVSFASDVKAIVQGGHYVTPLGNFALGTSLDKTWDVYLFPYRYDEVVAGHSVREWIYQLHSEL